MLTLIKRLLAAAIVIAAVAAPAAAFARVVETPIGGSAVPVAPPYIGGAPAAEQPVVAPSSSSFHWGDAGIGAGGLLVLIGLGAGAAVVYRRRAHPLAT